MEVATYKRDGDGLWVAHVVDHEGEGPRGEADKPLHALYDLARELHEGRDTALFDCLAAILREEAADARDAHPDEENEALRHMNDGVVMGFLRAARIVEGIA